ncbi:slime mold cyclic amp receptor protein [Pelomyxa schiedti]|nr:slime mold cyclic amp receptor protein [Pelomyxa schiedti]
MGLLADPVRAARLSTLVASTLSLIASAATVVFYCLPSGKLTGKNVTTNNDPARRTTHTGNKIVARLVFCMQTADMFSSLFMIASTVMLLWFPEQYSLGCCVSLRAAIQVMVLSSFAWSTAVAFYVFRDTSFAVGETDIVATVIYSKSCSILPCVGRWNAEFIILNVVIWGLTVASSIYLVASGNFIADATGWCHPELLLQWILWYAPMIIVFLVNLVLYLLVLRAINKVFRHFNSEASKLRHAVNPKIILYSMVIPLCWGFSLANHIQMTVDPTLQWVWLWILGDVAAPLHGFFNFWVYSTTSSIVKFPCGRHKETPTADSTPFLPGEMVGDSRPIFHESGDLASRIVYDYEP